MERTERSKDYRETRIEFYTQCLQRHPAENTIHTHEIEVDWDPKEYVGEPVFLAVVRYSTGSTFGRQNGYWHIEGAYLDCKEAHKTVQDIIADRYSKKGKYTVWKGYFERLEYAEVKSFILL
jgi:hypothetical protein